VGTEQGRALDWALKVDTLFQQKKCLKAVVKRCERALSGERRRFVKEF
jgi:hypothetical protein